jgi:hypothetical protein
MKGVVQTPWTDEERALLRRLRANGVGLKAAAAMMGRSYHSIQRQVRYLGLQLRLPPDTRKVSGSKPAAPTRAGRTTLPPLPSLTEGQEPPR